MSDEVMTLFLIKKNQRSMTPFHKRLNIEHYKIKHIPQLPHSFSQPKAIKSTVPLGSVEEGRECLMRL